MPNLSIIVAAALGGLVSLVLIPFIRRYSSRWRDGKGNRSFHQTHKAAIPRFGGVALASAFALVGLLALMLPSRIEEDSQSATIIFATTLLMFFLGFWDDLRPLGARWKLGCQVLIAALAYSGGIRIEGFQIVALDLHFSFGAASFFVTVFWLVALTNLINLIDGIDGLAGGITLMLMVLLCFVGGRAEATFMTIIAAGMAGALVGFLKHNFPPATIYMGDGGAYMLGFLIGALSIENSQKGTVLAALIAPLFALALPIIDVSVAILRRGLKGLPVFRPDRRHIHHRLVQFGLSRRHAVVVLYGISLVCLALALGVFWSEGRGMPVFFGVLCLTLLLAARSVSFGREWLAVGRAVANSLSLRKDTKYALALCRWLELEAERRESLEELWEDFCFLADRLGFVRVIAILPDCEWAWHTHDWPAESEETRQDLVELGPSGFSAMEFTARSSRMDAQQFDLLTELTAEGWAKAFQTWHRLHEAELPSTPLFVAHPLKSRRSGDGASFSPA